MPAGVPLFKWRAGNHLKARGSPHRDRL